MRDVSPLDDARLRQWALDRSHYGTMTTKRIALGVLRLMWRVETLAAQVQELEKAADDRENAGQGGFDVGWP